jgi:hypothetical protein
MLRQTLPRSFALEFRDADLAANQTLTAYEESLFLHQRALEPTLLADLIRKTEEQGDQYDQVCRGDQQVLYPRPFLFSLLPMPGHASANAPGNRGRMLCLYDNAGESFSVGKDTLANPVTHHLARANLLFFLFDPTQDPRFRAQMDGQRRQTRAIGRQDTLLTEAIHRIRRLSNLEHTQRSSKPLVLIVTKYDTWKHLVSPSFVDDPWRESDGAAALDLGVIGQRSDELRALLQRLTPEVVGAAESIAEKVTYLAVSALGCTPTFDAAQGKRVVRPADIQPRGVATPIVYGLSLCAPGFIPARK